MITRETIKKEIDHVREEYLGVLYKSIRTLESPPENDVHEKRDSQAAREEWYKFIDTFAGCMESAPISRGDQGTFEVRENLD